uniref:GH16 domain-containing protein n=1 Tax=Acrobeloides nanus TaxID=290746 RepID=A0A914CXL9_9BILA
MPTGPGTWPAYWLCGPNWPNNGEIDILEGVDGNNFNSMTLHTSKGCYMSPDESLFKGHFAKGPDGKDANDCYIAAQGQYDNQGCSIQTDNGYFGPQFNAAGGGVFAFEWKRDQFMKIWVFKRNEIPSDINQVEMMLAKMKYETILELIPKRFGPLII